MTETRVEHPGPALVVKVLEAARALVKAQGMATVFPGPMHDLSNTLEALDRALWEEMVDGQEPEAGHWHPATWADVKTGDRVRIGQAEADVELALPLEWVGSGASQVQVKLEGRPQAYAMPPTGPVEVWVAALPDWAGQAFLALADAFGEVASRG